MCEKEHYYLNKLEIEQRHFFNVHKNYIPLHYKIVQKLKSYTKEEEIIDAIIFVTAFTIIELHKLKESKITIKDYYQHKKSLENAIEKVKAYSLKEIYLDNYPMHPSDIFHQGFYEILEHCNITQKELKNNFGIIFSEIFTFSYSKIKVTKDNKNAIHILHLLFNENLFSQLKDYFLNLKK